MRLPIVTDDLAFKGVDIIIPVYNNNVPLALYSDR